VVAYQDCVGGDTRDGGIFGALDFFFGWVLRGIIDQNFLYIALAGVVVIAIAVSAF
jgi:hypothetical protein